MNGQLPRKGVLEDASSSLIDLLTFIASPLSLKAGEHLFQQGDEGDTLYAVETGLLEISVLSAEGRKLSLDLVRSGSVFGEIALFDPGPRTATVTSLEPSALVSVKRSDLVREIINKPELGIELMELAARRMRLFSEQLHQQAFLKMSERLARNILHLTEFTESQELALSQSELSNFSGASREAVSRTLADWRQSGIVDIQRNRIRILDRNALRVCAMSSLI